MRKPPDLQELESYTNENYKYDFVQAEQILEAMDSLREEAVKTRIPEVIAMVEASFRLLVTSYYCILRYEMTKLPGTDDGQ